MRVLPGFAVLALSTAACSVGSATLPHEAVVLDGKMAVALLQQCSRDAPAKGEGTWPPNAGQIAELEAALPEALEADRSPGNPRSYGADTREDAPDWSKAPAGWRRQYVGIVRHGRRFIYGNFFPKREAEEFPDWRKMPAVICDGGPEFFGAEYDVDAHRFTQFAFNGVA